LGLCLCVCCYCCRYVLDMARVRHIVPDPSDDNLRLVIFSDLVTDIYLQGLPEEKQQALKKVVIADVVPYDVVLDYPYWPVEHILKEILPAGCEVPSSFETIGMFMWVVYINCMIWTQCEPQLQTLQPQALNLLCEFGNVDLPRSSTYICVCKLLSRPDM
jgi:hypothetical protein